MAALIEFVCICIEHSEPGAMGAVTVHGRSWAYCPRGAADGHEWVRAGGITVDTARRIAVQQGERIAPVAPVATGPRGD